MEKKLLIVLIGLSVSSLTYATSIFAKKRVVSEDSKFRITIGTGYGFNSDRSESDIENMLRAQGYEVSISDLDTSDIGHSAWLGWKAYENIILELGYLDFGGRSAKAPNLDEHFGKDLAESLPVSGNGFSIAARPTYDLSEDWSIFVRVGAMNWSSDLDIASYKADKSGTDLLLGAGVDYQLEQRWLASVSWDSVKMNDTQNHLIGLNLSYLFGFDYIEE